MLHNPQSVLQTRSAESNASCPSRCGPQHILARVFRAHIHASKSWYHFRDLATPEQPHKQGLVGHSHLFESSSTSCALLCPQWSMRLSIQTPVHQTTNKSCWNRPVDQSQNRCYESVAMPDRPFRLCLSYTWSITDLIFFH